LAVRLTAGCLLGGLLHFVLKLARLIGDVVLLAGHLVQCLRRARSKSLSLLLQLGQLPLQIRDRALFVGLSRFAFTLLQVAFGLVLVLSGCRERLFARLRGAGWSRRFSGRGRSGGRRWIRLVICRRSIGGRTRHWLR